MINEINETNNNIIINKSNMLNFKEQLFSIEGEEKDKTLNLKNNFINKPNEDFQNINNNSKNFKDDFNNNQIKPIIKKVKTFNKEKRTDKFGNTIIHGGKQKISFIDKISKNNFVEVIKIENYKQYNKMEEPSNNKGNNCCLLF